MYLLCDRAHYEEINEVLRSHLYAMAATQLLNKPVGTRVVQRAVLETIRDVNTWFQPAIEKLERLFHDCQVQGLLRVQYVFTYGTRSFPHAACSFLIYTYVYM